MNLHQVAAPMIGAINPFYPIKLRVSMGVLVQNKDGTETPGYETPGKLLGSILGSVLTVATIGLGRPGIGQTLSDLGGALAPGTTITGLLAGDADDVPSQWSVSIAQTVALEAMKTTHQVQGQIQPITWKDLQQMDGLLVEGIRWKVFMTGQLDGVVRSERKGGDLLQIPPGHRHSGTWLIAQVLEQWPDWVSAAITFQSTSTDGFDC